MKKIIKVFIIIFILATPLFAIPALDITDVGVSAESIAVGGTHGTSYTANSIFTNPALLNPELLWSVDGFRTNTLEDVIIHNLSGFMTIKDKPIAFGYMGTSIDDIPMTKKTNKIIVKDGRYRYSLATYYAGFQHQLTSSLSTGISAKITKMSLFNFGAKGFNTDIAMAWIKPYYHFSVVLQNALWFQNLNYNNGVKEKFPFNVITNISRKYQFKEMLTQTHFQFQYRYGQVLLYGVGTQFQMKHIPYLEALIGYRTRPHLAKTIGRYSVGFNLQLKGIKLSYAYEKSQTPIYDNIHYVSLHLFKLKR